MRVRQYYQDLIAGGEFPQLSSVGPPEPTSAADRDRFFVAKSLQCSLPTAQRAQYQPRRDPSPVQRLHHVEPA